MIAEQLESALVIRERRSRLLEEALNAYDIWGTIGVDFSITRKGMCIKCTDEDIDTAVELIDAIEINAAFTASLVNVAELRELLPPRPPSAVLCPQCKGVGQSGVYILCETCKSLGWVDA